MLKIKTLYLVSIKGVQRLSQNGFEVYLSLDQTTSSVEPIDNCGYTGP